ncbi:hypothetical protein CJ030_MR2G009172 [Morella rubra]|uniref:ACT domain-containing protein n=1 Tax=Morella rubra TaxID=262757 RepID=A0A6A1WFC9_9ROSI|nr:hypothetical protein CJ030_MR2G009172 [Morella rubra]
MSKSDTILKVLQGCNSLKRLQKIHAYVITIGLQHHPAISSKILNFCAVSVSGSLAYAQLLFHHIENPQTEAWNSIIRGFANSASPLQAIFLYNDMVSAWAARPDTFTFSFVLKACERVMSDSKCREVHGTLIRSGYERDVVVSTNLTRSYAINGFIGLAQTVFDNLSDRDLVSWNSMISCYSQAGFHHEALKVYDRMKNANVGVDGFTLVGLLSSCAHVGALNVGVHLHRIARELGFLASVYVGNALIDMYAKCGSLDDALCVFESMQKRDVFSWNSMIAGYGVNGLGNGAISIFRQMLMAGVQPNSITFLGLLCGCSHQGLVEEAVEYFHMMSSKFNLKPGIKHYGCMVDLFGRAGKLEKALEIIGTSPSPADPVLWRTLLGSCKIHKSVKIGETALKNLVQLGASNAGDCILLATIYAGAKDTGGVSKMRKLIKTQGIKTMPGYSWIEVGDCIHKFVVDDNSHRDYNEIYHKLREAIHHATLLGIIMGALALAESRTKIHPEESSGTHSKHLPQSADVTGVLCELELTIKKVKVVQVIDYQHSLRSATLRISLGASTYKEEARGYMQPLSKDVGDAIISCDISMVGPEITACSQTASFLPSAITEDLFELEVPNKLPSGILTSDSISVTMDNSLSPAHTLVQLVCKDHKGLLYDIMRTVKDYNTKISYGRFSIKQRGNCEIDLFIVQADGKKIVDPSKQNALSSRLRMELFRPLKVAVVSRGPDTELLVANPVELSGKGRPLVFHDITLALKMLNTCIFSAEIGRHVIGDREYEVYRVLLDEGDGFSVPRNKIEEGVWKMLMGWA